MKCDVCGEPARVGERWCTVTLSTVGGEKSDTHGGHLVCLALHFDEKQAARVRDRLLRLNGGSTVES